MRYLLLALLLAGCTSVSITSPDGKSTMGGSLMNGSMSYSEGPGCVPTAPNPQVAAPVTQPQPLRMKQVCDVDGKNCSFSLMAVETAPVCDTQIATVKSTDFGGYVSWMMAAGAAIAAAVIIGG